MNQIFLGLGANQGNKKNNISDAVKLLEEKVFNIQKAPLYRSKAVGYTNQDDFLNTAISGTTNLSPEELLTSVKDIEKKVGRVKRFRWGPREIDIDILFYTDVVYKSELLQIPHPRLHERDFVLIPLVDLNPDLIHPVLKKSVRQLLNALPEDQKAVFGKI